MKRLNNILFLLLISITISLAQNTQITLDTPSVINPTDPFMVTGSYTLAIKDTLSKIQYYNKSNPSTKIEVTDIDTINQTFSVTLNSVGSLADGEYNYIFQLILLGNSIGDEDKLQITVDKTPPGISEHTVTQAYWSFAFPQFDIKVQFNEKVNLRNDTKIKLISEKGRELIIPQEKITLQNDSLLFIQASLDMINNDSLAQWTGKISLSIEKIEDIYGNAANLPLKNVITADFIKPQVVDFTPHYAHISTEDTTLQFTVTFNEPINQDQNLIKIKKENLEIVPALEYQNNKSSFIFTLQLNELKKDSLWNGNVEIEMQAFNDQAGNTNNAPESVLPRIFIDFLAPQVTQTILSIDSINIAFISQNNYSLVGLIRFNEPLDTSNTEATISLSNQENELSIPAKFLSNQQEIRFVINQEVLEQEQKSWQDFQNIAQLFIKNVRDTIGNKTQDDILIGQLKIDVVRPSPPTLTNEINSIVKEKSISFEGTKEYKAKLYFNGEVLSDFTNDSTWNKYNVFLPSDGFYKFSFWQIDPLGNVSDTVIVRILADRQTPHLVGQGAQLQINTDQQTNKPYFILYLYFNEIINFKPNAHFQLKTDSDYLQIEASDAKNLSTIQKFIIRDSAQINQLFNWIKQQKDIQLYLPAETIADLAGNKNSADITHDVFVFIENLIAEVSWINKYISPDQDGVNDELKATIFLSSQVPDLILFRCVVLNKMGQGIFQTNEILNISEDAGKTKPFDNGQLKINASGTDSNRVVYFNFKWAPPDLEEGKYTVNFYVQEIWEEGANLNIGSLPASATIYSDVTPPEIVRITPVAGDNNQYIDIQPDFVFAIDNEKENSPMKDAYLMFSRAIKNDAIPIDSLQMDLFPYKPGDVYEFNCKAYNIKLVPGALTVTVTLVDSANNKTLRRLHYTVVGDTVDGIKDIYNFPNPFNPKQGQKANIAFAAGGGLNIFKLYIFDMGFNLIYYKEFFSNLPGLASFRKTVLWDGTNLRGEIVANGVYFARIVSDKFKSPVLKIVVNNK